MQHRFDAADRAFVEAFERCELAAAEFNHRAHVRLAYVYLIEHSPAAARERVRVGLERFLAHLGAPASKYHETLTTAWVLAVHHFMCTTPETENFEEFARSAPQLFEKEIMATHFTPGLLMSDDARQRFVEPDRQPIPRHGAVVRDA